MIDEVNELYDPLLDDLDMDTLMEDNMDSESVSKNRVWGVKVKNPTQKKQGIMVTQERPGTQGKYKVVGVCTTNKSFYDPRGSAKEWVFVPQTSCFYDN